MNLMSFLRQEAQYLNTEKYVMPHENMTYFDVCIDTLVQLGALGGHEVSELYKIQRDTMNEVICDLKTDIGKLQDENDAYENEVDDLKQKLDNIHEYVGNIGNDIENINDECDY